MNRTIGFIGCGNMGGAILQGIIKANLLSLDKIIVSTHSDISAKHIHKKFGVATTLDNCEVVNNSDIVILAIKPNMFEQVLEEIKNVCDNKLIVSVAAGISIHYIMERLNKKNLHVVRAMPNTPASVMMAMSSLSFNEYVNNDEKEDVNAIFESFGSCAVVDEVMIHAVIGISGSSPAYIFMVLDAMIQNGMKHGLSKEDATHFASQAVMGAAKMVSLNKTSPEILKENVCSPGGTTIEAVHKLEAYNIGKIFDEAMDACIKKSMQMSK